LPSSSWTEDLAAKNREFVSEHHDLEFLELARARPQRCHREHTPEHQAQQRHGRQAALPPRSPAKPSLRLRPQSRGALEPPDGFAHPTGSGNTAAPATAEPDVSDQVRKLAQLRDEGLLTDEELQAKKTKLLGLWSTGSTV
jgi:hypothetical protein